MNREIKFRFWDKKQKKMVYHEEWYIPDCFWKDTHEIMQYTDLKDKNGKEVYEGDIVKNSNYEHVCNEIEEVFWDEEKAGFAPFFFCGYEDDVTEYEVIGNICENPDIKIS